MKTSIVKNEFPIKTIEEQIGYCFKNKSILEQAFTRRSYVQENQASKDNEVLEFIGDSIIGQLVVKKLTRRYTVNINPNLTEQVLEMCEVSRECLPFDMGGFFNCELDEAELSELKISLVQRSSLAAATERLGLEKHLILGKGDIALNVQNQASVKEDLLEAIFGAVALDSFWDMVALEALMDRLMDVDEILEKGLEDEEDYEKLLFDWFADRDKKPVYEETFPIINLKYGVSIDLGEDMFEYTAYGYGNTELGAIRMASKRAMKYIRKTGSLIAKVKETIGSLDMDRSINQLQELYQKGVIPEPKYNFSQCGYASNGNPMWTCECTIEGIYESNGSWIVETKKEAKVNAAIEALSYLLGEKV